MQDIQVTTSPVDFSYSAQVKNVKNSCGLPALWMAGVGSSISYCFHCSVSGK
jgi:hypothetical protein